MHRIGLAILAVLAVVGGMVQAQAVRFPSTVQVVNAADPLGGPLPVAPAPVDPFNDYAAPVSPELDPFGSPVQPQPTVFGELPALPGAAPAVTFTTMTRFLNIVRFEYAYFPGNGVNELGINDIEINGSFSFPLFGNIETPVLVTPGFATHFWSGPKDNGPDPTADMPPSTYDAYLDVSWTPQLSPVFGAELGVRVGVYSDFTHTSTHALRITGSGLFTLVLTPTMTLKAGVSYLDRNEIKLLPMGGIEWFPHGQEGNCRMDIFFPSPKLACRINNGSAADWWWYVRGDYGGGNWAIKRQNPDPAIDGMIDTVDYNDIRVALGIEVDPPNGCDAMFEVGISFDRELVYRSSQPRYYRPNTTMFLGAKLFF